MSRFIGIDPGLDGAVVGFSLGTPELAPVVQDTPTLRVGKGGKRTYNTRQMVLILGAMAGDRYGGIQATAFIEKQQARPKQGVSSTFSTGYGYGLWVGIASALEVPYVIVSPLEWQRELYKGVPAEGKDRSILVCERLFPGISLTKPRGHKATLHGRSDAALIAEYGRRTHER